MRRMSIISVVAILALVAAACGGDDGNGEEPTPTGATAPTGETAPAGETETGGALSEYGESTDADPALVEKALGPVSDVPDIVLASIARADQGPDQATIDKAMECWNTQECDTGSGGELVMGYADGGGHLNVWRAVTHMEAILQALTYPEIGTIVSTAALWDQDPAVPAGDIRFLIQRGADFIIGYPDAGVAIADAILEATAAGIPYIPFSAGWVGLPGQEGALVPGEDYLTVVGEDLCALGESFADVLNDGVDSGTVGVLGGTPGNALSLGWQQCLTPALNDGIEVLGPADTYWLNDVALQVVSGWLSTDPDIAGYAYEYSDGLNTALQAYDDLGIELNDLTVALRTDEQTLFCDWVERDNPNYHIWFSAGGNFQSRTAVTAAMLHLQGAPIPAEIVVPHVMREVGPQDCNADRATPAVSGTSLVPDNVLSLMFAEG
jgi:ribose transport system substrate-binding protein